MCTAENCPARHDCDFKDTPCADPIYIETGICPHYMGPTPCMYKHARWANREQYEAARVKAIEKYPKELAHLIRENAPVHSQGAC